MPWLLVDDELDPLSRTRLTEVLPAAGGPYGRLYAMGMDAYGMLPHLARLQTSDQETLDGHTGNLYLDELNQVHRQLVWVQLDETPRILGYSPRLDAEMAAGVATPSLLPEAVPVPPAPAP
jgi:outer membrane PBP1 activator LpoA protein